MLYFVGVGPGDPELITMKAARVLREADAIAIPDSGGDSVVWKIVGEWMQNKPLCRLPMPMKGKREDWVDAHHRAVETLLEWLQRYEIVAYPVLGDPSIYASGSYLLREIAPLHSCRVIPGVPAMCAAAAELGIPLCEQGERLTVMDQFEEASIPQDNVVIMKGGKKLQEAAELAKRCNREIYAVCNLGMENMCTGRLDEMVDAPYSYFTTLIAKPACDDAMQN